MFLLNFISYLFLSHFDDFTEQKEILMIQLDYYQKFPHLRS